MSHCVCSEWERESDSWINYDENTCEKVTSCDWIKNLKAKREIFIYDKFATRLIKFSLLSSLCLTLFFMTRQRKFSVFSVYIARFVYQIHDLNNKTSINVKKIVEIRMRQPKLTERHQIKFYKNEPAQKKGHKFLCLSICKKFKVKNNNFFDENQVNKLWKKIHYLYF